MSSQPPVQRAVALMMLATLLCHSAVAMKETTTNPNRRDVNSDSPTHLRKLKIREESDEVARQLALLETDEEIKFSGILDGMSPEEAEHIKHMLKGFGKDLGLMTLKAIVEYYEQHVRAQTFATLCKFSQPLIKYWQRNDDALPRADSETPRERVQSMDKQCTDCFCQRWELASFLSLVCSEGFSDQEAIVEKMKSGIGKKVAKKVGVAALALVSAPAAATVQLGLTLHKFYKLGESIHHASIAADPHADRFLLPATYAMCELACGCQDDLKTVFGHASRAFRDVELLGGVYWYQMCQPLRPEYSNCWSEYADEKEAPSEYILSGSVDDRMDGNTFDKAGRGGTTKLGQVVNDKRIFDGLVNTCKADWLDDGRSRFDDKVIEAMDSIPDEEEPSYYTKAIRSIESFAGQFGFGSGEDDSELDRSRIVREFDEPGSAAPVSKQPEPQRKESRSSLEARFKRVEMRNLEISARKERERREDIEKHSSPSPVGETGGVDSERRDSRRAQDERHAAPTPDGGSTYGIGDVYRP